MDDEERVIHLKGGPYDGAVMTVPMGPTSLALDSDKYYKVGRDKKDRRLWVHSSIHGRAQ